MSEKKLRKKAGLKVLAAEFKKIVWPDQDDTCETDSAAVVVTSVILGAIIALIDFLVQHGIDILVNLG